MRKNTPKEIEVVRVTPVLRDQEEELAVAVVLGHGVRASPIDAAGDPAVGLLILGVPLDVGADGFRLAEAQQGGGN